MKLPGPLAFPEGERYPARHEVVDAELLVGETRTPVVVKKTRLDLKQRLLGSKGERSFRVAKALLSRGLPTPEPLGVEKRPHETWFVARKLEGAVQVREWFLKRDDPRRPEPALPASFEEVVGALGRLARSLHDAGVFFRDFTDGNVLVTLEGGRLKLWLVDLNRVRLYDRSLGRLRRLRDLARPGINREEDHKLFLKSYFGGGEPPTWALAAVRALRLRVVLWDDLKRALRPWRT